MTELVEGRVSLRDLREVRIEDLLGREAVAPDERLLARVISGKTVMVTGAGGSIGSELCRQILRTGPARLVLAEMNEANLFHIERELRTNPAIGTRIDLVADLVNTSDQAQCDRMMARWKPHTIFHAAAYKHVPLIEANVLAGLRNNIESTLNVAQAARVHGCRHMVLISSDKAVRPTNVMGASKRVCELVLQAMADEAQTPIYSMVRFGNVLGSSGSVVPQFEEQIARGGPVTITHRDITRFFMTIPEAAQLVIQAGGLAQGGEVFLLDMGEPIRIADLAKTMIELSGRTVRGPDVPEGDIEIREIGLRPGEKLYEELLIDCESSATPHPRILLARESGWPAERLFPELNTLRSCLADGDREGALAVVKRLVPEYVPDTSLREFAVR
jgi:FlaA1/EpsC-like NDP-sugar epimerase